ncbi:hypothetical protein ACFX12_033918 [Malus domestica]
MKAGYELFFPSKALRLIYPAKVRSNPMPAPPAKEDVLPFLKYPKTHPPISTRPQGIVKLKSCIFSNWVSEKTLHNYS